MKLAAIGISEITVGKHAVKDPRLDQLDKLVHAKKKTYVQVEVVSEDSCLDADALVVAHENRTDLILRDLEFVETRLSRATDPLEQALLVKFKAGLEKEMFVSSVSLSDEERQFTASYGLYTDQPVVVVTGEERSDINGVLARALVEAGYISFFTAGEKETRAWLIKKGTTAWEAAGVIHSDIQRGFIRAEIIAFDDYVRAGGETQAKQAGAVRLEQKDYVMQDTDVVMFRFNK